MRNQRNAKRITPSLGSILDRQALNNPPPNREINVRDIDNGIGYWFIKVKVLHIWPRLDSIHDYAMLSLEMVLMDFEGTKIQGTVPVDVFNSENFDIAEEDIVGLCTSISSERVHFLDGRVVNVVLLEITDETGSLECVLYDQYVDQIHGHIKINGMKRTIVVLQFTKMVAFDPALFGDCVIQIIPNVTRLLFNPPIDEVFDEYDRLLTHGIDLISPLRYVLIDRVDVDVVDDFLFSFRRKELRELCFQAKAGRYIVLATLGSIVGNDQWYNLKAQVFDGDQRLNLLLSDHNVMKVLVKFTKQPIIGNLEEAFQCIIGKKFLFIVEKGCGHTLADDDWLRVRNLCGDLEILRVFVDRDYYSLDIMTKAMILTALRKYTPLDDSFLTSNRCSGVGVSESLIAHNVGETSSSACGVEYPIGGEKPISRSSDSES
ncbi:Nucleic acid-binding, OB-fold [Sesbania bispinosa]|nr:Nucleic acid-binding, OB-fold [Sesbania bispinosa]